MAKVQGRNLTFKFFVFFLFPLLFSYAIYSLGFWWGGVTEVSKTFEYCESIGKTISGIGEPAYCIDKKTSDE